MNDERNEVLGETYRVSNHATSAQGDNNQRCCRAKPNQANPMGETDVNNCAMRANWQDKVITKQNTQVYNAQYEIGCKQLSVLDRQARLTVRKQNNYK